MTQSPPSAHSSSTRAWQRATGGPTDTHKTVREELGHDVGADGPTAAADAAFFAPGGDTAEDEEPQGLLHHCCRRLPGLSSRSSLSLTGNLPSHAVRDAVASPKTSDEEFLVEPVDRVATEVELIVTACDLVARTHIQSSSQTLSPGSNLSSLTNSLNQPRGERPTLKMRTPVRPNLQTGWS